MGIQLGCAGSTGDGDSEEAPAAGSIIALGSQDARLTVWRVDRVRPIVVANRVFKHTVVDLAWTPDGYHLIACSMDGTLAAFHFDPGDPIHRDTTDDPTWLLRAQAVGCSLLVKC